MSIEEVTEIFGEPYTRMNENKHFWGESTDYYWDDWGVIINPQLRDSIPSSLFEYYPSIGSNNKHPIEG